jgi:hypothetical protein
MAQKFIEILRPDVQNYIRVHAHENERELVLKNREILGLPVNWIAEQLAGRRKAKEKFPTLYKTPSIIYPPSINIEQSSSEATAEFKATLLASFLHANSSPMKGADLTGGLGIDSFFLSRLCDSFDYVETDTDLVQIAHHNHSMLGAPHIRHHQNKAEGFLKSTVGNFDFIFIDPSRRNNSRKVFRLADCEPVIMELLQVIFERSHRLLLKVSPLLDLQQGSKELRDVERIIVLSVENECKEVLFLCKKGASSDPLIHCVNILPKGRTIEFTFTRAEEKEAISVFSDPLTYLYEPNASVLKGGAFKLIGQKLGLAKVHPHTHLYTSENLVLHFPGRIFKIEEKKPVLRNLGIYFPENKANVVIRNYPLSAEQLKKKLKLNDGGEKYLIGFSGIKEKFTVAAVQIDANPRISY